MSGLANLLIHTFATHSMVLAAFISLQTLENILNVIGYPAVTLFVMIESFGIPFPGETMLLLASFYAGTSNKLAIPIVIACAALGAIVGDNLGYLLGRTGGRALALRYGKYIHLKPQQLDHSQQFFEKHGDKTVFFGRFLAVLRTWAAFLAGVNHMPWRKFLVFNAAGGILWAITYGILGFVAGRVLHDNFAAVEHIASTLGWIVLGVVVVVVVVLFVLLRLRRRRRMLAAAERGVEADAPDEQERVIARQNGDRPATDSTASARSNVESETRA
jgi:membrane protein DedA with SNARE-associated domain